MVSRTITQINFERNSNTRSWGRTQEEDSFSKISQLGKPVNTLPSTSTLLTNASGKFGNHAANAKEFYTPKNRPTNKSLCIFCSGHRRSNECTVVKDPTARKNIVFQAKLCFNCLNTHRVSECHSRNRCRGCHKKHHTSLCNETNKDATKNTGKNHAPNNDAPNITTQVQNAKTNPPVDKTQTVSTRLCQSTTTANYSMGTSLC
jgi:hypothetical protein